MAGIEQLDRVKIETLADLERFVETARETIERDCIARTGNRVGQPVDDEVYIKASKTSLFLAVVRETLSDQSVVYDVQVSEAPANEAVVRRDPGAAEAKSPYDEAVQAIAAGKATAYQLWVLLSYEHQRDGYALKPLIWEGTGEYQHVTFADGRDGFVRIPEDRPSLKTSKPK